MIIPDLNLRIYAHNPTAHWHGAARIQAPENPGGVGGQSRGHLESQARVVAPVAVRALDSAPALRPSAPEVLLCNLRLATAWELLLLFHAVAIPPASAEPPGLARLTQLADTGAQLASQLEAGQAQMPLTDGLRRAAEAAEHAPLRVLLCGLSPDSVARTLSHLLGHDFNFCKVVVPRRVGYTEVVLQERGFVLEVDSSRTEFENLDTFIQALEERDLVQAGNPDSWMDPRRLRLTGPADAHGLSLLIPDSVQSFVKRPALLSLLSDQADWIVLAGERDDILPAEARTLLQVLADSTGGLCCVVLPGGGKAGGGSRWWEGWRAESIAPPLLLADGNTGNAVVLPANGGLRAWLRSARRARELEGTFTLLGEQLRQQIQALQNRRRLQDDGLVARPGADAEVRKLGDTLRSRVQQDLDSVVSSMEDQMRQALLADGPLLSGIHQAVAELAPEDIEQVEQGAVVQLHLARAAEQRLQEQLLRQTRAVVLAQFETVHEALETSVREAGEVFGRHLGRPTPLSCEGFDAARLWENVGRLARPEIRYQGEMPRMTWLARIMSARQIAFGVMMLGMLLGSVATMIGGSDGSAKLRNGLYVLILPLFLGGFLYTFVSARKKEDLLLAKEVEKLRTSLVQELRRVAADLAREATALVKSYLQKAQREVGDAINARLREHDEREARRSEQTRTQAQDMVRTLDGRLRQLGTQESELKRLQQGVAEVRTKLRDGRRAALGC